GPGTAEVGQRKAERAGRATESVVQVHRQIELPEAINVAAVYKLKAGGAEAANAGRREISELKGTGIDIKVSRGPVDQEIVSRAAANRPGQPGECDVRGRGVDQADLKLGVRRSVAGQRPIIGEAECLSDHIGLGGRRDKREAADCGDARQQPSAKSCNVQHGGSSPQRTRTSVTRT